jgi:ABC-type sugar transport system ATPase subunit
LFVADFVGTYPMNFLDAATSETGLRFADGGELKLDLRLAAGQKVRVGLRPEQLHVDPAGPLAITVDVVEPLGSDTLVYGKIGGDRVLVRVDPLTPAKAGDRMTLSIAPEHLHIFDLHSTRRIG